MSRSQNVIMWLNIGESTSKAITLSFDSEQYCEWRGENLSAWEVKNLLKLNVYTVNASAITYLLHNGLAS